MVQPLCGIKVVEFGGFGPGPFAATVLADMGAQVIRLQRHGPQSPVDLRGGGADLRFSLGTESESAQPRLDQFLREWDLSADVPVRLQALVDTDPFDG
jgi:crotonobetainyl-CoA:carnitine CoA-transferase CaiB-like acyl-CoA transferase